MGYVLAEQSGDSLAVPQIVVSQLTRCDGDTMRVALYLLQTGETDPAVLAKTLALPSVEAARRALQFWAGAGLLQKQQRAPVLETEEQRAAKIDLSSLNDPYIAVLCEEAQTAFGKALSRSEMQRLVALYLNDGWPPDVILLCCAEVARQGRRTVAAAARELSRWQAEGVQTGEEAERHLRRLEQRAAWQEETAALLHLEAKDLTAWERRAVTRWHEEWRLDTPLIEEAFLHAGPGKQTVRYLDGILRAWRAQGITTVDAARGQGQLSGSNILTAAPPAATAQQDLFNRDWNALFDEEE